MAHLRNLVSFVLLVLPCWALVSTDMVVGLEGPLAHSLDAQATEFLRHALAKQTGGSFAIDTHTCESNLSKVGREHTGHAPERIETSLRDASLHIDLEQISAVVRLHDSKGDRPKLAAGMMGTQLVQPDQTSERDVAQDLLASIDAIMARSRFEGRLVQQRQWPARVPSSADIVGQRALQPVTFAFRECQGGRTMGSLPASHSTGPATGHLVPSLAPLLAQLL
mmetsp:Transcript_51377/g.129655  ORF Transcript_51377/g.129655 Transcript_51377/m.129655 type:complete len:223 (+) Transcript_51377:69-737(+)